MLVGYVVDHAILGFVFRVCSLTTRVVSLTLWATGVPYTWLHSSLLGIFVRTVIVLPFDKQRKPNFRHLLQNPLQVLENNVLVNNLRFPQYGHGLLASFLSHEKLPFIECLGIVSSILQYQGHSYIAYFLIWNPR